MLLRLARKSGKTIEWLLTGKDRVLTEIGISQNYLSMMERGKVEIGAEILLRISREFVKGVDWLLTGEGWRLGSCARRSNAEESESCVGLI